MSDSEFKLTSGAEDFVDALYRGLDSVWDKVEIPADKIMTILIIANKNEYLDPKELNRVAYRLFRQSNNKEWSIDEVFEPYKKKYCKKAVADESFPWPYEDEKNRDFCETKMQEDFESYLQQRINELAALNRSQIQDTWMMG